jgi:hypothetical protein
MLLNIRAHFDGKVFIPDEPVELPVDQPLTINVEIGARFLTTPAATQDERERAFQRLISTPIPRTTPIPDEALRRETMYDDRDEA